MKPIKTILRYSQNLLIERFCFLPSKMSPTKKRKVSLPTEDNVEQPSVIGSGPKEATYFAQSREQRPEAEESVTSEKAEVGGKAFNINMERQERFKALQARAVSNPRITQACVAM